jgi:2,3-bisphosphoglycerate-independent phosphoglycerate mutase
VKTIIILLDGVGDRPSKALQGLTPLQAARIPFINGLAAAGRLKNLATAQQYANITRLMAMRCSAGKEADNTIWVTN